jgi:hypothetical protein
MQGSFGEVGCGMSVVGSAIGDCGFLWVGFEIGMCKKEEYATCMENEGAVERAKN